MNSLHVKKNDIVVVLSGEDKGKAGKVLVTLPGKGRVVVEGVNLMRKALRKSQDNPKGGVVEKENPIHASNVALVDPKESKPTRVGFKVIDGRKVRFARRSGEIIDR